MPVTHERWLVALSLIVAIQGAYVGLSLAVQVAESAGLRRRLLLAGAALSLAVAIWAMHFVGMLAARVPFPVDYLVLPTLLSFLVCVIVVGAAVYATSSGPLTLVRLTLAAGLMGAGIFSMHYIGMAALHASAHMTHASAYVAASMAVAIGASGLALWLAGGRGGRPPLILSATAFGVAVSGMHYTAMTGLTVFPHATAASTAPALSTDLLAIVVAVVAFCVSGMFLLFLVPDRTASRLSPASLRRRSARPAAAAERRVRSRQLWLRSAGSARRRAVSRAICRWSATARPITSRSRPSWRSTPTRTTPTSSTTPPSCSARCRSAMSKPASTPPVPARASQPYRQYRARDADQTRRRQRAWSSSRRADTMRCRSAAAGWAGSSRASARKSGEIVRQSPDFRQQSCRSSCRDRGNSCASVPPRAPAVVAARAHFVTLDLLKELTPGLHMRWLAGTPGRT